MSGAQREIQWGEREGEREREGGNTESQCGEMTTALQEYADTGINIKTATVAHKTELQMHLGIQYQMEETLENNRE